MADDPYTRLALPRYPRSATFDPRWLIDNLMGPNPLWLLEWPDTVIPIHAEAHDLRFAHGYFDAVVVVDAYEYFGTADQYLGYLTQFVRPGGVVAIAEVGVTADLPEVPEHLRPYWRPDFWQWKSPDWWRRHWSRSGVVDVEVADLLEGGWREWLLWQEVCLEVGGNARGTPQSIMKFGTRSHAGHVPKFMIGRGRRRRSRRAGSRR